MSVKNTILLSAQFYPHANPSVGPQRPPVTVVAPARQGAGFYGGNQGLHTLQYSITNFIGTINIEATVCLNPTDSDWFSVKTYDFPNRSFDRDTDINTSIDNIVGKYTFIRASITYTFGSVSVIQLTHQ